MTHHEAPFSQVPPIAPKSPDIPEPTSAPAPETDAETATPQDLTASLLKQLEEAQAQAQEHWDMLLRTKAEMDNLRKRSARDLENAHKYALEQFVQELLPVKDSLEMGIDAAQGEVSVEKLREGSEMILRIFSQAMNKYGVSEIDPLGERFNPEYHQAVSVQPKADVEPNTVTAVMQKGYRLNDRLLRPAMVMVSKAPDTSINETA